MSAPRIRIALVTHALRSGGVSIFLFRLGRYLLARGWSVDLITTEEKGEWFTLAAAYGLQATHLSPQRGESRVAHTIRVGNHLAQARYESILLNHAPHAQRALGKLADATGVIPVVHYDDSAAYQVACSNRHAWNVLVAPGPKLQSIAQLEAPDRPVVMIPHGVAVPRSDMLRIEERSRAPLQVSFVGRIDESTKGISLIPKILAACRRLGLEPRLRIAGAGPDSDRLEAMIGEHRRQDQVEVLGLLEPLETYRLLLDSHILILPSTKEGFAVVPLEAQACGCVPICSNLPGATDVTVEENRTGFLVGVGEVDSFAERIVRLDRDRSLWKKLSAAGHAAVSDHFRLEQMGLAYEKLILDTRSGRYPLTRPRRWRRPFDLSLLPGDGFLVVALRRIWQRIHPGNRA